MKNQNSFGHWVELQTLALGALIAFGAAESSALAGHHHHAIHSAIADGNANCVFPSINGAPPTSPQEGPEVHCYDVPAFLKAYGIDQLHAMGLTGKGQTIILVDSFGSPTLQADLDFFSDTFGLPHTTIQFIYPNGPVYPNGTPSDLSADALGWAEETTLDLEWAHAIAPDAQLVNVVSNSSETTGMAGMADIFAGIDTAIALYPNAVLSMSFGTGESTFAPADVAASVKGAFHATFQKASDAGITLLASSGDSGSAEAADMKTLFAFADAGYPSSDSLVTSVGGTAIESDWRWNPEGTADDFWNCQLTKNPHCPTDFLKSVDAPGQIVETVWKEDWALAAGGGGVSKIFSSPSYQANLPADVAKTANGFRTLPDVSLNAAINGGVMVYMSIVSPKNGANGPAWQSVGGTSCASPETAGLIALAGQQASIQLGHLVGIGSLNSILYNLPASDFNDIVPQTFGDQNQVTLGDDSIYFSAKLLAAIGPLHETPVAVPGYSAAPGYDIATGLGTPKAVSFVVDVARARVAREQAAANKTP